MTKRSFIFCDICNPEGIRIVNQRDTENNRRGTCQQLNPDEKRENQERRAFDGRRISDGRSWYEGSIESSIEHGWLIDENDFVICPKCRSRRQL